MATRFDAEDYKAKRKHKWPCDLCGASIRVGQRCRRWKFNDDGLVGLVRVHRECEVEALHYDWYNDLDGWPDRYPLAEERAGAYR